MQILGYFDRPAVVHLPDRDGRLRALTGNLSETGIDINSPKLTTPNPPIPATSFSRLRLSTTSKPVSAPGDRLPLLVQRIIRIS
jgi:hypothetical protein